MRKLVQLTGALLLAGLVAAGCGGTHRTARQDAAAPQAATTTTLPGSPDIYRRIAALNDCALLQGELDRAEATSRRAGGPQGATWSEIGVAYMQAADDRMRQVGCY